MEEETKKTARDVILSEQGRKVKTVEEVKEGDILGIYNGHSRPCDFRLYYVERVDLEPYLKSIPLSPAAILKKPHVGVASSKPSLDDCYIHLHVSTPGHNYKRAWSPIHEEELDVEYLIEQEQDTVYRINQGTTLYEWGQLIPFFELPNWDFLFQSKDTSKLKSLCEATKTEFENAQQIYARIKEEFEKHTRG